MTRWTTRILAAAMAATIGDFPDLGPGCYSRVARCVERCGLGCGNADLCTSNGFYSRHGSFLSSNEKARYCGPFGLSRCRPIIDHVLR